MLAQPAARDRGRGALAWSDPTSRVSGLGPATAEALAKSGIVTVADLVWTLPSSWDDARAPLTVGEAIGQARGVAGELGPPPAKVCVQGQVKSAGLVPLRGRRALRVVLAGEGNEGKESLTLWWFFAAHGVLAVATPGAQVIVTGKIVIEVGKPARMAHPDLARDAAAARKVTPRYPRLGIAEGKLRTAIGQALDALDALPDFVPSAIVSREKLPPVEAVLRGVHGTGGVLGEPPSDDVRRHARERLAWAEAFTRAWERLAAGASGASTAPVLPFERSALARLRAELGFELTSGQEEAIAAVAKDLARPRPMRRLLLGDVGTGKTAVALAAAAQCVAAGAQVAILAPTSVLAEQYMDAVGPLARATGASVALVAAGVPPAQRKRREAGLAKGTLSIAVGTHALLREGVTFHKLGLVIVDEQHRLGVAQRLSLVGKGERPHLLTLSATPIPRTLALALRGELETSELGERPRGRPPVTTEVVPRASFADVVSELRAACARDESAFVIAPRIEAAESEDADESAGAVKLAEYLRKALAPAKVGIIHGSLPSDEKRSAMRAFRAGETSVLVATTVVEVGIDVPRATLIVIGGAERFGLAQLHQLRGRVGRGDKPGRCILVHGEPLSLAARARLEALVGLERGVDVARADLELRGAGDLGGTRQAGVSEDLLYLDPASPPAWLARIDSDARAVFADDPTLARPEHHALALAVRRLGAAIAVREEAG